MDQAVMTPCRLSVIIPARDEALRIGACLDALLTQDSDQQLTVIVAVNASRDATAAVARSRAPRMLRHGHELVVLDLDQPGKPLALNTAEHHAPHGCRVYLDADAVLSADAIGVLHSALHREPAAPRLVSPRLDHVAPPGQDRLTASYFTVWRALPAVEDQVIGGGCYAVNALGRARWKAFPALVNDDAFVRGRFAPHETTIADCAFTTPYPDRTRLLPTLRRWHEGNRQLAAAGLGSPSVGAAGNLARILRRPALWPHLPAFALVTTLVQITRRRGDGAPAWTVHRSGNPRP
jgi:glycosyltransferase involved in cell wall biosynthesis